MRHQFTLLIDINECDDDNGGCSQICSNTDGSFDCECYNGYDFTENSTTLCIGTFKNFNNYFSCHHNLDIDECIVNNGGCQEICTNTNGSFYCSCPSGYSGSVFCSG